MLALCNGSLGLAAQDLVGRSDSTYACSGIAILLTTRPVSVTAAFTKPSVPAENVVSPSQLNVTLRQPPL